jgi:hypothetical protein
MAGQPRLFPLPDRLEEAIRVALALGWEPAQARRGRGKTRFVLPGTPWCLSLDHHDCTLYAKDAAGTISQMHHVPTGQLARLRQLLVVLPRRG